MEIQFPTTPTDGQIYNDPVSGFSFIYDSATESWDPYNVSATFVNSAYFASTISNYALLAGAAFTGNVSTTGSIGINVASPQYSITTNKVDAYQLPQGNTSQRPSTNTGLIRYNSETNDVEVSTSNTWYSLLKPSEILIGNGIITDAYYSGTSNNAIYLNGRPASTYVIDSQLSTILMSYLSTADFVANLVLYPTKSNDETITGVYTFEGNVVFANAVIANGTAGNAGQILTTNGSAVYWSNTVGTAEAANTANTANTANNASYLDGNTAADLRTYTDNQAGNAYSNAILFASNASNVNTGTLSEARLPYRMNQNVRTTDTVEFAGLTLTGNLVVSGNVNVIGANNLSISDNMIYLNSNNDVANPDLGFAGNYNDGTYHHAGFFRDATDGVWKVFDNYLPEPDASVFIDTSNNTFHIADFQANQVFVGNTTVYATINTTNFSGTANNAQYLGGNSASDLRTYTDNKAGNAYSNAIAYSGNAAQAYANAIAYSGNAAQAYANAIAYSGNAAQAYANAIAYSGNAAQAYTNAVAYVDGKSYVNTSQLSSNLSSYQTTAGLASNVATLTANNANNLGGFAANNYLRANASATISAVYNFNANVNLGAGVNLLANDSAGTNGQVLTTNGTAVYWANATGGGGFTNGQSISVNNFVITGAFTANSSNGSAGQVLATNGSAVYWTSVGTNNTVTTANSQTFTGNGTNTVFTLAQSVGDQDSVIVTLDGLVQVPNTHYTISNTTITFTTAPLGNTVIEVRTIDTTPFANGQSFTVNAITVSSTLTVNAGLSANGLLGTNGQVLTSNGTVAYWANATGGGSVNVNAQYVWTNTHTFNQTINGTANNALYLNGNSAGDLQTYADNKAANAYANAIAYSGNAAQAYANAIAYSGNAAQAYANAIAYSGNAAQAYTNAVAYVDGKSYVNTSQLSSNLSGYQTTAGLSANVATLTSNNATNLGGVAAAKYVQNTDSRTLSGNLTFTGGIITLGGFGSNVDVTAANFTISGDTPVTANNTKGTAGQVLTTTGSGVYWSTPSFTVNTAAQYTWTNTHTFNSAVVLGNSSVNASINSTSYTGTANNANNLGGVAAASYVQNTDSRTLSGNLNFTGANTTIGGNLTIATTGDLVFVGNAGIYANGSLGTTGQVLTTNGTAVYWAGASGGFTNGQSISVNNFVITGAFSANSSNGSAGQVLTTNGSAVYWSTVSAAAGNTTANSQVFTGNGTNTVFTLAESVSDQDAILVALDGLLQIPNTDYTASGTTLTFTSAPVNNTSIEIRYISASGGGGGSVSNTTIVNKALAVSILFGS